MMYINTNENTRTIWTVPSDNIINLQIISSKILGDLAKKR